MSRDKRIFTNDDIEKSEIDQILGVESMRSAGVVNDKESVFRNVSKGITGELFSEAEIDSAAKEVDDGWHSVNEHEVCTAAGQINALGVQLAQLALSQAKLELRITTLENSNGFTNSGSSAGLKSSLQQLRSISSQLENITQGLRSTPGYNIGKTFNCSSCGAMGVVAVRVKCTNCDKENWWGWWPNPK